MRRYIYALALLVLIALSVRVPAQQSKFKYRWIYVQTNLQVDSEAERVKGLMKRAATAGYNGIVLADYKLEVLDRVIPKYFQNAADIKRLAQELKMQIITPTCGIGYSSGILAHDPNLAEGMPVRDAPFLVRNGQADIVPDPATRLKNGDFESADNHKFAGYGFQDDIGQTTFADTETKHGGRQSLRIENISKVHPEGGNARVVQKVTLTSWRQYHLSVWIKTQDFASPGMIRGTVIAPDGKTLDFIEWHIEKTQDWKEYHLAFNSQKYDTANVYLGVWGGTGGKLWFDDAKLEETGLLNVLRRPGCPLLVKNENGAIYKEGIDYEKIVDPQMGRVPWEGEYDIYHTPPAIKLTANSPIKAGQTLRVSYYHSVVVNADQVACCLSEPGVYDILKEQAKSINETFHPDGFFMSHDEMRTANWCDACQKRNLTPGQLLADNAARCAAILRATNPKAELFVWSDMFDPTHNAVESNYYLVNGSLKDSWKGLPKEVTVVNWNQNKKESLQWFAGLGHSQILAGYYDGDPNAIKDWLNKGKDLSGIVGVMYTTWGGHFDALEAFAKAAWGN